MLRDWRKDEPTQMDPDLIDLVWEMHNELGSAEPINVISGYRSRDTNEHAAPNGRRPGEPEPPHSRQGHGRDLPGRAGEEAALLCAHPRARRRRLLPDLGHAVRAHRHRPRARLAARHPHGAGAALPQRPHPACARRRRADHARGRAPGARRQLRGGPADRRVPRAARAPQGADPGCVAGALAAAAAHAAAAGGAAGPHRHAADRSRAGDACGAGGRAAAAARHRSDAGESPAAACTSS